MVKTNTGAVLRRLKDALRLRTRLALLATGALLALSQGAAAETTASNTDAGQSSLEATVPQVQPPAAAPSQLQLLVAAAESGNVEAMNAVGVLLALGARGSTDYETALYWFQKAIDGGSAAAMNNMGAMYLQGVGVPRDYPNAFRWFARAAEGGNADAMYSAGVMADMGLGTTRDPRLARAMYRRAAESGFAPAMVRVSDDCAQGSGASANLVEAYAWLQIALQTGLPQEMQIAVLAKVDALGARLGAQGRDEARVRATQLAALVRDHAVAAQSGMRDAVSRTSFM